jgi:FkbM family methyltransferase
MDYSLIPNYVYYANSWEKEFIKRNFANFNSQDSRIVDLLSGLDGESAETVIRIINQIRRLKESNYSNIPIYTEAESALFNENLTVNNIVNEDKVLCLGGLYVYKGYFLTQPTFSVDVFTYKYSIDHISHHKKIVGKTIVDIGGYNGDSSIVFNRELCPRDIFVIEPVTYYAEQIKQNFNLNGITNGTLIQCALGDKTGEKYISVMQDSGASSLTNLVDSQNVYNELIKIDTLDNITLANDIKNICLIKIDVEGYERFVLKGAKNTIINNKPTMLISIYHNWDDFCDLKSMIESLNLGYKFKIVKEINGSIVLETLLIAECEIKNEK